MVEIFTGERESWSGKASGRFTFVTSTLWVNVGGRWWLKTLHLHRTFHIADPLD